MTRAFSSIPIKPRLPKPRNQQLTMMVDFGLGIDFPRDLLTLAGDYVDLAKIAVGISALLTEEHLSEKIDMYRERDVTAFPGGQFLEYAIWKDKVDEYFSDAQKVGYQVIEVSDNLLELSGEKKREIIIRATNDFGFKVLGEVGSKSTASSTGALIEDILNCLEAGAWKVLVEAAEFFEQGRFKEQLAAEILEKVSPENVIFELPGTWIPGIAESDIHSMQVWLLEHVGDNVSVGNVSPSSVLSFEALRRNLGVKMNFD